MAKFKGVTFIQGFVFDRKGEQITTLRDALEEEAKCGIGLSYCDKALILIDTETGTRVKITVADGELVVTPIA